MALDRFPADQLQISFVHHGCRFQSRSREASDQMPASNPPEFGVHDRHQIVEGLQLTVTPGSQQTRNVRVEGWLTRRRVLAKDSFANDPS